MLFDHSLLHCLALKMAELLTSFLFVESQPLQPLQCQ